MKSHSKLRKLAYLLVGLLPVTAGAVGFVESQDGTTTWVGWINDVIGATAFYHAGVLGQGASVANVEADHFWNGHESLAHVTDSNAFYTPSGGLGQTGDHATGVAQIIGGRPPEGADDLGIVLSSGIAPHATLYSGALATEQLGGGYFEISQSSLATTYAYFFGRVDVINSSWGGSFANPQEDFITPLIDGLAAANTHTTMVAAAGNAGPPTAGESSTVAAPAVGFNVISVGGLGRGDDGDIYSRVWDYTGENGETDGSSRGLATVYHPETGEPIGQRVAVHIVAPADNLLPAAYAPEQENIGPDDYWIGGAGTSYAAPQVAGGVALMVSASRALEEQGQTAPSAGWDAQRAADSRDARVIKAVLLNSADKLAAWDNRQERATVTAEWSLRPGITMTQDFENVIRTTQALDDTLGAGALNLDRAFEQYVGGSWLLDSIGNEAGFSNTYTFNASASSDSIVTMTLVWFAEYSEYDALLPEEGLGLLALANLDLEIWSVTEGGDFETLLATSTTTVDTVEHLSFALAEGSRLGVRVVHNGMVFDLRDIESLASNVTTFALAWGIAAIPEPAGMGLVFGFLSMVIVCLIRIRRR